MTLDDDRTPNPRRVPIESPNDNSRTMWIVSAVAAMLVLGILVYGLSSTSTDTASNNQPATSSSGMSNNAREMPATTGSAASGPHRD